ncbi:MAG: insulinase family protein [Candidatus Eremiobacteraeota bacterium]|nr:insulinase family protein [Candidatus Eremiobacteraeota bacterium]
MRVLLRIAVFGALFLGLESVVWAAPEVTRATLGNGMKVIVVHDSLAPVVTTVLNYKIGSNDEAISGLAHATEHMMFRGSKTISESLFSDISQLVGGDMDADTQSTITQYYFTVPSQYLDIALRLEASRAQGLILSQKDWDIERGAILNEVTQDNSIATYRLFRKVTTNLLGGTPYANETLGTLQSFRHQINAPQLQAFYRAWYHPNNAVFVIVGDVDGAATLAKVRRYFGSIPAARLPPRRPVALRPTRSAVYREESDFPVTFIALGYRLPGYSDPDYAAVQIMGDVLNSQRSKFYDLVVSGKVLYAGFNPETFAKAGIGVPYAVVPVTTKPEAGDAALRSVLEAYRKTGLPADLVEVAKQRQIAQAEFKANSISQLAFEWSEAVAAQGRSSPDELLEAYKRVTEDDVNRVFRKYFDSRRVVAAYAVPKNLGKVNAGLGGSKAAENNAIVPSKHEPLPAWAKAILSTLSVPKQTLSPTAMTLSNGIRLIVQPETVSHTIVVSGEIRSNEDVQAPKNQEGVADLAGGLIPFGTTTYNRVALRTELDKIAADTTAGTSFSLTVLSKNFDRGTQLLADEELHPAFPEANFNTLKAQTVGELTGQMDSPDHLAEVALTKALYPASDPAQRFATPQSVGTLSLENVKEYFANVYRPDLTTIVVIGDTTPDRARSLIEKYFSAWKAEGPKPNIDYPTAPNNAAASIQIPATGRVQSSVRLVEALGLTRLDPDYAGLRVADTVYGRGFSSILFNDLREKNGLVYSANSNLAPEKTRSTFEVDFASDPNKIEPAQRLAITDLRNLGGNGVNGDQLTRSKAMLLAEVPLRQQSFSGVASLFLRYSALGLPLDQNLIDAGRELALSADQMRAVVSKWIRPNDFVRIVIGPAPK